MTSPEAALSFYADRFHFADPPQERHIQDDKALLAEVFRPLSNRDPANGLGIHRLEAIEYIGDQHSGIVVWRWCVTDADRFFGLATGGLAVQTTGMSFHRYENGKITREIVYSDQIHVAQQLGIPVVFTPAGTPPALQGPPSRSSH